METTTAPGGREIKKRKYVKRAVARKKSEGRRAREWKPVGLLAEKLASGGSVETGEASCGKKRVTWDLNLVVEIEEKELPLEPFGLLEEDRKENKRKPPFIGGSGVRS